MLGQGKWREPIGRPGKNPVVSWVFWDIKVEAVLSRGKQSINANALEISTELSIADFLLPLLWIPGSLINGEVCSLCGTYMRGCILPQEAPRPEMGQRHCGSRCVWFLVVLIPLWCFFSYFSSLLLYLPLLSLSPSFLGHCLLSPCAFPHHASLIYKAVWSEGEVRGFVLDPLSFSLFHTSPHCQKCFSYLLPIIASWLLLDSWEHWDINNNAQWYLYLNNWPITSFLHFTLLFIPILLNFSFLPFSGWFCVTISPNSSREKGSSSPLKSVFLWPPWDFNIHQLLKICTWPKGRGVFISL